MRYEIQKHWDRLLSISKLSDEQLQISYSLVLSKLKFISEEIIPLEIWLASEELTKDIDINDIDFVALTKFLSATLWIGDKVLYNGLKKLDFNNILKTKDFLALRMAKNQN